MADFERCAAATPTMVEGGGRNHEDTAASGDIPYSQLIETFGGNDTIYGGLGNDTVDLGSGNDWAGRRRRQRHAVRRRGQ